MYKTYPPGLCVWTLVRGGRGKEGERAEMDADLQREVAFSVAGILFFSFLIYWGRNSRYHFPQGTC